MLSALASLRRLAAVGGDAGPEGGLAVICSSSVLRSAEAAWAAANAWREGGMETSSSSAPEPGAADCSDAFRLRRLWGGLWWGSL